MVFDLEHGQPKAILYILHGFRYAAFALGSNI